MALFWQSRIAVRLVRIYLSVYYVLLIGAAITLWQSGVLDRLPGGLVGIAAVVAVGLGILLWVTSRSPAPERMSVREDKHGVALEPNARGQ